MTESQHLTVFREGVRAWLQENFPPSLAGKRLDAEGEDEALGPDLDV